MRPIQTYTRPTAGWWRKNPYYRSFVLRELSSFFIYFYALNLLLGLYKLTQGETAYSEWLEALGSPLALFFHCLAVAFSVIHTVTWFRVAPKTMPVLRAKGSAIPERTIIRIGWLIALGTNAGALAAIAYFGVH